MASSKRSPASRVCTVMLLLSVTLILGNTNVIQQILKYSYCVSKNYTNDIHSDAKTFMNTKVKLFTNVFNVCRVFHNVDPPFERRLQYIINEQVIAMKYLQ